MAEAVALQGSARTRPSKTPESAHFPSCDDRRHLAAPVWNTCVSRSGQSRCSPVWPEVWPPGLGARTGLWAGLKLGFTATLGSKTLKTLEEPTQKNKLENSCHALPHRAGRWCCW